MTPDTNPYASPETPPKPWEPGPILAFYLRVMAFIVFCMPLLGSFVVCITFLIALLFGTRELPTTTIWIGMALAIGLGIMQYAWGKLLLATGLFTVNQ